MAFIWCFASFPVKIKDNFKLNQMADKERSEMNGTLTPLFYFISFI